ncbi:MAG: alpha-glucan family phosphorylase [candidate division Zixibacteria bacterium]|nr:alpha-glucan family phosphorylase [candidate division Zixibacteria bacterium]
MVKALRYIQVEPVLPEGLKPLRDIAYNLYWCWNHEAIQLLRRIDYKLWEESGHNPVRLLSMIPQPKLEKLERDAAFRAHLESVAREFSVYMNGDTWFGEQHFRADKPEIAYFSAEYGLTESLPIYSGGLGVLAGDHLKSASDLGLPLVGVGLLYQRGYFQQYLNADGWQGEYYPELDFSMLPLTEVTDKNGDPLFVTLDIVGRKVSIKVWRIQVGRVPLLLLDTNLAQNAIEDRDITSELYGGDTEMRIKQEMVLGIGGVRALESAGLSPSVYHMNEGHSAFLAIDRIRRRMQLDHLSFNEAAMLVKQSTIFTTHTPVPAGIDRFPRDLIDRYLRPYYSELGLSPNEFFAFGSPVGGYASNEFNMAHLAMNSSSHINGVSKLHAEVSRKMWQNSWPGVPLNEVPIDSITNGIHTRSWISQEIADLYGRYLGLDWMDKPADHSCWSNVDDILDSELWRTHELRREKMISLIRQRLKEQYQRRGASPRELKVVSEVLNSELLTVGFARRFASYKRGALLFRDMDRLKRIVNDTKHPVQFVFAGKAHPRDNIGKELIKTIVHTIRDPQLRDRVVFLENYDLAMARYLVQGVDVWLNTPRRPMEASGTSGMKVVFNGGLNVSVLDGWWVEGYRADVGWAIGSGEEYENHDYQDEIEANALYDILEKEVAPTFYDRGRDGIPREWVAKMKRSIKLLNPMFNSNRMVQEYADKFYMSAFRQFRILENDNYAELRSLASWYKHLKDRWADIRILELSSETPSKVSVATPVSITARIFIGEFKPDDLKVELYIGRLSQRGEIADALTFEMDPDGSAQAGVYTYRCHTPLTTSGRFGYSVRVLPGHRSAVHRHEFGLITWANGDV